MSRRKQAKPRALKRELEDEDGDDAVTMTTESVCMTTEPADDNSVNNVTSESADGGGDVGLSPSDIEPEEDPVDSPDEDGVVAAMEEGELAEYRCEACDAIFHSLTQFMDHRNYDCVAVDSADGSWASRRSSSPSSDDPSKSPDASAGSPYSPSLSGLAPEQVPFATGVSESHPYGCQFCDKAFARLSYLKKHEQLHSDQMPFKCNFCNRLFKHKRSRDRHVKLHTGDKKYKCPHCQVAFARSDHLKIHVKTHDNGKPFQCTLCKRGYTTAAALTSHMLSHKKPGSSSPDPELTCIVCEERFPTAEELDAHAVLHEEPAASPKDSSIQCLYCSEMCSGAEALELHVEQEHSKDSRNKCPFCTRFFMYPEDLFRHMKCHTLDADDDKNSINNKLVLKVPLNALASPTEHKPKNHKSGKTLNKVMLSFAAKVKFPCDFCNKECESYEALQAHKEMSHASVDMHQKNVAFCSQCTMGFPDGLELSNHIQMVHSNNMVDRPNSVDLATKKVTESKFSNHERSRPMKLNETQEGIEMHSFADFATLGKSMSTNTMVEPSTDCEARTCDQCNATFLDFQSFQAHMKTHMESAQTVYSCSECQAQFTSDDQLENHIFVHYLALTTEYGCTSCLKLFTKPDELQKHLMDIHAHHLYRCSLCKEIFDSKVNIQVHFAVKHSNECKLYKCTPCGSVFRSEMEWQLHVKVNHLGMSKPYRCLFCKESFVSDVDLQCHLTTHKKQFPCPLCDEAFHVEYLLDRHMQTKHCPEGTQSDGNKVTKVKTESEAEVHEKSPVPTPVKKTPEPLPTSHHSSQPVLASLLGTPPPSMPPVIKTPEAIHRCSLCDLKFPDELASKRHYIQDHCLNLEGNGHSSHPPSQKSSPTVPQVSPKAASTPTTPEKFSQLCVYCNQTFKTKGELEKHMKTHVTPSTQKCNICDEVFPSASILAEHKLQHCKVGQGNVCVVCKVTMKNEEQFYAHSQQHGFQGSTMQCIVCRQTLASMIELQMHGKHHFQNTASFYTCCVCLRSFDSKENLVSKLNSSGRSYYVCKPCYHGESQPEFRCASCNVKFETQAQLDAHALIHKKTYQCIKCQESFASEYEIQVHVATHMMHEGNVHECKMCNKTFDSPAKLQCHLIEHTFDCGEFQCYICNSVFSHATGIQMHVLEHGIGARRYACAQCPQRFFFSAELQNHLYSHGAPASVSEFTCPDCNKTFTSVKAFSNHRKVHAHEEKNALLKCSLCPEVFKSVSEMQQHFFGCHSEGELKKTKQLFPCTQCNREFSSISNLQAHMMTHNMEDKYSCKDCGKEFSLARNLQIHMRSHSTEKPYECPVCHKRFSRKENRKAHMKSHGVTKPYLCPICSKCFSRKGQLKDHMQVHFNQLNSEACVETNIVPKSPLLGQGDLDLDSTSDSLSVTSISPVLSGQEVVDQDTGAKKRESKGPVSKEKKHKSSAGRYDGEVTIVTNMPEQVTVT